MPAGWEKLTRQTATTGLYYFAVSSLTRDRKILRVLGPLRYRLLVEHISEGDLVLYSLGLVRTEDELRPIEEHLLCCHECLDRAEEIDRAFTSWEEPESPVYARTEF